MLARNYLRATLVYEQWQRQRQSQSQSERNQVHFILRFPKQVGILPGACAQQQLLSNPSKSSSLLYSSRFITVYGFGKLPAVHRQQ